MPSEDRGQVSASGFRRELQRTTFVNVTGLETWPDWLQDRFI